MFARACRALLFAVALLLVPAGPAVAESPTGPAPVTVPFTLDDRIDFSVNPASGNLFLSQQDDGLTTADGTYWDLSRYYNSQGRIAEEFAWGWSGRETALWLPASGDASVTQLDVGGYQRVFTKLGSAFVNQLDDGVTLAYINPSAGRPGGYTATYPDGTVRSYHGTGEETSEVRPGGHQVTNFAEYPGHAVSTWTYSDGPRVEVGYYNWYSAVDGMYDLHGNFHWLHVEEEQIHLLERHVHPDGRITDYEYPPWDSIGPPPETTKLSRVSTSTGVDARFQYDAQNRITQVKVIDPADLSEDITTFAYTAPDDECSPGATVKTIVTNDDASTEYFCSNAAYEVTDSDFDGVIDLGPGDDGSCTAPPDEVLDCGEGDVAPEDVAIEPPGFSALDVPLGQWGMATDTSPIAFNVFEQPAYKALNMPHVRHIVPWNVASNALDPKDPNDTIGELEEAAIWAREALESNDLPDGTVVPGPEILFSFEKCRHLKFPVNDVECAKRVQAPSKTQYVNAMNSFFAQVDAAPPGSLLANLQQVRQFTAWNEPNLRPYKNPDSNYGQPVGDIHSNSATADKDNSGAFRAGLYWKWLNGICKGRPAGKKCTVIAGDFSDGQMNTAQQRRDAKKYYEQYRAGMGHSPKAWAWHGYADTDQRVIPKKQSVPAQEKQARRWKRFQAFEVATRRTSGAQPPIFITEVGVVRESSMKKRLIGNVNNAMRCLVGELPFRHARVKRFYYYQYIGNSRHDSGLVEYNSPATTRAVYDMFKDAKDGNPPTCPVAP